MKMKTAPEGVEFIVRAGRKILFRGDYEACRRWADMHPPKPGGGYETICTHSVPNFMKIHDDVMRAIRNWVEGG